MYHGGRGVLVLDLHAFDEVALRVVAVRIAFGCALLTR